MNPALTAVLAAAGLLAAYGQRAVIVRLAVPAAEAAPPAEPSQPGEPAPPAEPSQPWKPPLLAVGCASAILLGLLTARVHPGLVLAAACWLALCAVPLAFIDTAVQRLPDQLTGPAYAGTVLLLLLAAATGGHWPSLLRAVLGGLALTGCYLLLAIISPSGMGLGDVKLAASLGTLLAWSGWRALIAGGAAGFLLAGLYGLALLAAGRAHRKQQIPVGPFMIAGAFLVVAITGG